ncbi:FecCD family ABC transporter permease [Pseudooceanicola sp. 502str34]
MTTGGLSAGALPAPHDLRRVARQRRLARLALACALLLLACLAALMIGARAITPAQVWAALTDPTVLSPEATVIRELRLPRLVTGLAVGAALSIAGLMMQSVTRNPLADPGILGMASGAGLAVVIAVWAFGLGGTVALGWASLAGAAAVTAVVVPLGLSGPLHSGPARLVLAGVAVAALAGAGTTAILLSSQETLEVYRFWMVGSLASGGATRAAQLAELAPFFLAGLLLALLSLRGLDSLALGEETAGALGAHPARTRLLALAAAVVLAGAATALAGPIGFLGLVTPHLARALVGPRLVWALPATLLIGPAVLLLADTAGRVILPPGEVQAGIMMALLGGPVFVAVARRRPRG